MTFAKETQHNGIDMTLIGQWGDLAAYYAGSDGNAWCFSGCTYSWSNEGPIESFRATFSARRRGKLFQPMTATEQQVAEWEKSVRDDPPKRVF